MASSRFEFQGQTLTVEYTEYGDRLTGELRLPSGTRRGYEICREIDFVPHGTLWSHDDRGMTPEDLAVADSLFPYHEDRYGRFRRPSRELRIAAWAQVEPEWTPRRVALEMSRRVPTGTRKEDFLPFVTAVLQHLTAAHGRAIESDNAAASFGLAGEELAYLADFRRLTGRDFDRDADRISGADVEALPITPPAPPEPIVYGCLECGAEYNESGHIESGGMGCDRCNSVASNWRAHLVN